jgi:hypothetical protein
LIELKFFTTAYKLTSRLIVAFINVV